MWLLAILILRYLRLSGFGRLYTIESIIFLLGSYVYFSYALYTIASKRKGVEQGWLAWIPLADIFLLWELSDHSGELKMIILLVSFGSFFCLIINPLLIIIPINLLIARMWSEVANYQGIPRWFGAILIMIPIVNIAFIGYLAFSD